MSFESTCLSFGWLFICYLHVLIQNFNDYLKNSVSNSIFLSTITFSEIYDIFRFIHFPALQKYQNSTGFITVWRMGWRLLHFSFVKSGIFMNYALLRIPFTRVLIWSCPGSARWAFRDFTFSCNFHFFIKFMMFLGL